MSKSLPIAALALSGLALAGLSTAWAAGNLASKPTTFELKIDSKAGSASATQYVAGAGKYYKWHISGDNGVVFRATQLFNNSWINQVAVNDAEIVPSSIDGIKLNGGKGVDIFFVPLKPGEYDFSVSGMGTQDFVGKFRVTP